MTVYRFFKQLKDVLLFLKGEEEQIKYGQELGVSKYSGGEKEKQMKTEDLTKRAVSKESINIFQRIILIIGAIIFVAVLLTSPKVKHAPQGVILKADSGRESFAQVVDVRTALIRGVTVLGATVLLFFAVKSKGKD